MSGFAADWLTLREPADARARSAALAARFAGGVRRAVDLATGTGANIRYLASRLGGPTEWLAVDDDPALLGAHVAPAGTSVRTLRLDLAQSLETVPLDGCDLVSASALLDLVSAAWLDRLAAACSAARVAVLFALTYDGRIEWSPPDAADALVRALVNRHQGGDKGFGSALGPEATAAAAARFAAHGYEIERARTDWVLGPPDARLQQALVDGWLAAALEVAPAERAALTAWAERRRASIARGAATLVVGHADLAGRPATRG
jgi:hypothetical protein